MLNKNINNTLEEKLEELFLYIYNKNIYIIDKKIKLNPSEILKKLIIENPNYLENSLKSLLIFKANKYSIKPYQIDKPKSADFITVKLKNINHLGRFIKDIGNEQSFIQTFSTRGLCKLL